MLSSHAVLPVSIHEDIQLQMIKCAMSYFSCGIVGIQVEKYVYIYFLLHFIMNTIADDTLWSMGIS